MSTDSETEPIIVLSSALLDMRVKGKKELEEAGYKIIICLDCQSTLEALHSCVPQVLIADCNMLCADGQSLLVQLSQSDAYKHIPVLALLVQDQDLPEWVWEHPRGQTVCFLTLPFAKGELKEFIRRIIQAVYSQR